MFRWFAAPDFRRSGRKAALLIENNSAVSSFEKWLVEAVCGLRQLSGRFSQDSFCTTALLRKLSLYKFKNVLFRKTDKLDDPVGLGGTGTLEVTESRPWRWRARVGADGPVLAVLHVPQARGWRASLDGRATTIRSVNLAAMGVLVPAGEHDVCWEYHPPGFVAGVVLTLTGLAGCIVLAVGGRCGRGAPARRAALAR